jgi:hypothetical protein
MVLIAAERVTLIAPQLPLPSSGGTHLKKKKRAVQCFIIPVEYLVIIGECDFWTPKMSH